MRLLAVDSCSNVATCALMEDGRLVAEVVLNDKKTHSVKLLPQISAMLEAAERQVSGIDVFAVTAGPGSFTGQRIGIATVKGLAHACGKPCVGVSSLEALSYNLPHTPYDICPIMDARRGQVYTATFRGGARMTPDRAMALSALLAGCKGRDTVFLGDGVPVFRDMIIEALGECARFAPPHLLQLRGGSVAQLAAQYALRGEVTDCHGLLPLYLRLSQAEREYLERNEKT